MNVYTFLVLRDGVRLTDVSGIGINEQQGLQAALCKARSWYAGTLELRFIRVFEVQS